MSRNKKSRKQGAGSIGAVKVKDDKKKALVPVDRKPKNK